MKICGYVCTAWRSSQDSREYRRDIGANPGACCVLDHGITMVTPQRTRIFLMATTTLKLSEALKARIARLARDSGCSAHSLMIGALEREVAREEHLRAFVSEARKSDAAMEAGANVYRAEDVHRWLDRQARNRTATRPKPWRK